MFSAVRVTFAFLRSCPTRRVTAGLGGFRARRAGRKLFVTFLTNELHAVIPDPEMIEGHRRELVCTALRNQHRAPPLSQNENMMPGVRWAHRCIPMPMNDDLK